MIKSFRDKETQKIFHRLVSGKLTRNIQHTARRKLVMMDSATELNALRIPPGNRLEALKGNRKGQHSIRINDQWRICFRWKAGDAYNVEITDYHLEVYYEEKKTPSHPSWRDPDGRISKTNGHQSIPIGQGHKCTPKTNQ